MANGLISYQNWVDIEGATITASSEETELAATNVRTTILSEEVWQSTGPTAWLQVDWSQPRSTRIVYLGGLNLDPADTIRMRLSSTNPTEGDLVDTGAVASNVVQPYAHWAYVLPTEVDARCLRLDFARSTGFVRCGRAWAGTAIQPGLNYGYGFSETWEDASEVVTAPYSGAEYVNLMPQRRVLDFAYEFLTEQEAKGAIRELGWMAGIRNQLVFVPNPESPWLNQEAILGRMKEATALSHPLFGFHSKQFTIRQSL
jgi:hypothetical protein